MARQSYGADQNIHSMTTRQLRQYIADKAQEAQERLNTSDMEKASRAFKDAAAEITNRAGTKVRRSTSNMSKSEMREYAYALRQFNSLDQTSTFAKSIEWKENKSRYESFIRSQAKNDKSGKWAQYITPKGNVSKKGYAEYKNYIGFLRALKDVTEQYGYETIKYYYQQNKGSKDPEKRKLYMEKMLLETFEEVKGKNKTSKEINDIFRAKMEAYDERQDKTEAVKEAAQRAKKSAPKVIKKAANHTNKSSGAKVPIKKARKLKEHGKVRRTTR